MRLQRVESQRKQKMETSKIAWHQTNRTTMRVRKRRKRKSQRKNWKRRKTTIHTNTIQPFPKTCWIMKMPKSQMDISRTRRENSPSLRRKKSEREKEAIAARGMARSWRTYLSPRRRSALECTLDRRSGLESNVCFPRRRKWGVNPLKCSIKN